MLLIAQKIKNILLNLTQEILWEVGSESFSGLVPMRMLIADFGPDLGLVESYHTRDPQYAPEPRWLWVLPESCPLIKAQAWDFDYCKSYI